MSNKTETMLFQTEVNQLLDLMVHSLYSNREIFLRELISNASDALDKRRFEGLTNAALLENQGEAQIDISFDREKKTITLSDNGIGMTRQEVIENIGTIAKSGTKAFLEQLAEDQKSDSHLIGQFGVGFYSAFIVAKTIHLVTRKAGEPVESATIWSSAGEANFTLSETSKEKAGTEIVLSLREEHEDLLNDWTLRSIIKKYSDHIAYPVMLHSLQKPMDAEEDAAEKMVSEKVNEATSLWQRAKKDISEEEYQAFYKHVAHDYQNPLSWSHNKVEGNVSYTSLLYLPSKAANGMWEQNATHGVQLYVQRVFIMDGAEKLLPRYLRFVKGVIDAQDLPLNVSREILQDSKVIDAIRQGATKRVLGLLDTLAQNEPEKYQTFWAEFGRVLKEGLGDDFQNREAILKLLRFRSSTESNEVVSLTDYLARMPETQNKIYFLTTDNIKTAENSPYLEIFKKKGIEVLLMTEAVDDWMMGFVHEFEGKSFVHIAKGDIDLDEDLSTEDQAKEEKKEEIVSEEDQKLIEKIQTALNDKVESVKLSKRLTDSAACLVRNQNALSSHFERMLKDAGHEVPTSKPWLEINSQHPLFAKVQDAENSEEWIHLIYDQALLLEGSQLENPAEFVARLNRLMQ